MLTRLSLLLVCLLLAVSAGCQRDRLVGNSTEKNGSGVSDKDDLEIRYSLAMLLEQEGKPVEARQAYHELLQIDPENADYNHRYGITLCQLGEYEEGIEYLRVAESSRPDDVDILNDLGFACMVSGRNEAAISVLETALEAHPRNERATNNLAMAHGYLGEFDEAYSLFRQVVTEAQAMSNLGYVALQSGRTEFAVRCYSRALDLDPEMETAKEALVQLADLEQHIAHRKSIVAEGTRGDHVVHASATALPGTKQPVKHAD